MTVSGRPALIVVGVFGLLLGLYRLFDISALVRHGTLATGTVDVVSRRSLLVRVEDRGRPLLVTVKRPLLAFPQRGDRVEIYFDPAEVREGGGLPFEFRLRRWGQVANRFHLWFPAVGPLAIGGLSLAALFASRYSRSVVVR